MSFKQWALDTADRAGSTLVQAVIMFVLASKGHSSWHTLVAAVFPAVATVLLNAIPQLRYMGKNLYIDILVRSGRTFVVTVLGAATAASFDLFSITAWRTVAFLGGSAALVVLKSFLVTRIAPRTITPASLVSNAQYNKAA